MFTRYKVGTVISFKNISKQTHAFMFKKKNVTLISELQLQCFTSDRNLKKKKILEREKSRCFQKVYSRAYGINLNRFKSCSLFYYNGDNDQN